ncbi:hypothetical protein QE152_g37224 [Popillia japonica]|uniref:Reverse transcriptase n=1 Tax=Popillia japonica TaxID=7064 RepID=A0AAW1IB59_POPJA
MPSSDDETHNMVENAVSGFLLQNPIHPINALGLLTTPRKVREIISRTPSTKAPGPDNIQNLHLKNVPRKTLVQLTVIINGILQLQHFPGTWKKAIVVRVPKLGKNTQLQDGYRPISLLSTLSKIAKRVILEAILERVEERDIINSGFGHSTPLNSKWLEW